MLFIYRFPICQNWTISEMLKETQEVNKCQTKDSTGLLEGRNKCLSPLLGVSFKTFSLFFKVLFLLKTIWMKNSNFYQFWAVIAEEWKKFNGCFFKLLSSLPSCYCCGRLNRPLNLTFEFRIKTRNILKILPSFHHLWNYELLELSFLI